MQPERWQQIEQLYHAALEHSPDERAAFLDSACDSDGTLRQEVESLLAYDERAAHFITTPPNELAAELLAARQSPSLLGHTLAHYQIISLLGKGGMGEVYQARDTKLDRMVALKILPAEVATDAERPRRFVREAKAASALNHPHVATIHEIGEADGIHFIAMEYVAGQSLAAKINGAPLDITEIIAIGSQIADALDEAHSKGITHRDLKPANVMLNERGRVKVLDFGLAKITRPPSIESNVSTLKQTTPGLVMGTVPYMSPEQAMGSAVDHRSDIFSLGVVLYEMLAGCRPFGGATMSETIAAILRDEPPPIVQHAPACPAALAQIVTRCLAKAPAARYQTAGEIVAALQAVRDEQAASKSTREVAAAPPTLPRTEKAPSPCRRWVVIAGVMALFTLLAVLYLFRPRDTAEAAIKTLAVLPPRPLRSGDRDEAMELGTTSMLITRLSSLRQLIVRSESSVARYTQSEQDPLAAGREQKVDAVLDSRYQRSGEKVRFTLRLLRVADGATLWADTLDQQTADLFAIQDALCTKVTEALGLALSSAEKELLAKRYTNNAEAWQLYTRGRLLFHARTDASDEKAISYFQQAIALDPDFALAHSILGKVYLALSWNGDPQKKEFKPKAKEAIEQALRLDDQLAEAHTHLAEYKFYGEWDFKSAEQEFKRALALDPNSADVRHGYAFYPTFKGQFEQAISEIKRAEELDPTDLWISRNVAQVLYFAHHYDEVIEQTRKVIELNPNSVFGYSWIINVYAMKGDEQGFLASVLKHAELIGAGPNEIAAIKTAFAQNGFRGYWKRELTRLLEQEKSRYVRQIDIARLYAYLGDKEQALSRLQRAVEDHNFYAIALNVEPAWDSLRDDPRFVALVRRVGLAP